ncbi:MAG: FAD/NAD(P)-binding protein [Sphingomicrobium sp.]
MPPEPRRAPVAIVGGGFSGTMLAAQLARRGISSMLIEGGERLGRGTAYSTGEPAHVLNVRAEGMSAWPDQPDHFARESGDGRGFAERRMFGRYLRQILDQAVASGHVTPIAGKAVAAARRDGRWEIALDDGATVVAQAVALAIGNQPPEPFRFSKAAGERLIDNPWGDEAKAAIREAAASGGAMLLIGTGLTMVDAVRSLAAAGHQGQIVAVSRRGQVPKAHADFEAAPIGLDQVPQGNALALWRWLRRRSGQVGWRAAVDSLRPHSQALWQGLDDAQQRRFLRHARPYWDVHRHRIAPEVARQLRELVAAGRLEIVAGRIGEVRAVDGGLEVDIKRRGGASETRRFDFAINCTGPLGAIARTRDPLLRGLLDDGLVRPDRLGIGLEVDQSSRAAGAERLWALGPLTKGRYWEIVAVPDIRGQAAAVADDIASEIGELQR